MRKTLIIGANGNIGKQLTEMAHEHDDVHPVAFLRKKEQAEYFKERNIDFRIGDLEDSVDEIGKHLDDIDAVIFTAGSGGGSGAEKTLVVDLDGAIKSMEACEQKNVDRYLMVSALNAGDREKWMDSKIRPYYVAKYYADQHLINSDLQYTILRPGMLTDEDGNGTITVEDPAKNKSVPRQDVAQLLLECLVNDKTKKQILEFNKGEKPIAEVVESL